MNPRQTALALTRNLGPFDPGTRHAHSLPSGTRQRSAGPSATLLTLSPIFARIGYSRNWHGHPAHLPLWCLGLQQASLVVVLLAFCGPLSGTTSGQSWVSNLVKGDSDIRYEFGELAFASSINEDLVAVVRLVRRPRDEILEQGRAEQFALLHMSEEEWNSASQSAEELRRRLKRAYYELYETTVSLKVIRVVTSSGVELSAEECRKRLQEQRAVILHDLGFRMRPAMVSALRDDTMILESHWANTPVPVSAPFDQGQKLLDRRIAGSYFGISEISRLNPTSLKETKWYLQRERSRSDPTLFLPAGGWLEAEEEIGRYQWEDLCGREIGGVQLEKRLHEGAIWLEGFQGYQVDERILDVFRSDVIVKRLIGVDRYLPIRREKQDGSFE